VNRDHLHGYWLRVAGTAQRLWGAVIADETLRIHGERDRWMGQMEIDAAVLRAAPVVASRSLSAKAWRMR